jgi:hypothetical protein
MTMSDRTAAATVAVHVVRPGRADVVVNNQLAWHPNGAMESLIIDMREVFREALG